jgi:hypothetical protein
MAGVLMESDRGASPHRFRPTYAGANVGHPVRSCGVRKRFEGRACGIPHLAKNERDMGHPAIVAGIEPKRVPRIVVPPKKMKMARTNIEWVAQVSLLRPGCSGRTDFSGETQVSKSRPGPPTQSLEVAACFSTERTRISYFALVATSTCAALRRESRMQILNATGLDRKSGGA